MGQDHHGTTEPFPWFVPEGEQYVAVDPELLDAIRRIAELRQQELRIAMRVARIDRVSGRIVFALRIRKLDQDRPTEGGT
jgi:hypothetical protein